MERKIGETFEFEGKTYEVVKDFTFSCRDCDFKKFCSPTKHISQEFQAPVECANTKRSDKENVIFKEIKKNMEIKDNKLIINIPKRMEVDTENSDLKAGVIKLKEKELTYSDICKTMSNEVKLIAGTSRSYTKLSAISKLMDIADYYNKDWKPDLKSADIRKYYIYYNSIADDYGVGINSVCNSNVVLFKNKEDAQAVIDNPNFREILDAIFKN